MIIRIKKLLLKNKILKETFWSLATKVITFVLFYAIHIFLARSLGASEFGRWSYIFSIISVLIVISNFGLNASARKFVAQFNKTNDFSTIVLTSIILRIVVSVIFSLLTLLAVSFIHTFGRSPQVILILVAVPFVFFSNISEFFKDIFIGAHRIIFNFVINAVEYGSRLFLLAMLVTHITRLETKEIIVVFSISVLLSSALGLMFGYKLLKQSKQYSISKVFLKKVLAYSFPIFFGSIGFLIATEANVLMLAALSSEHEVGIYNAAAQLVNKAPHITWVLVMGVMPIFAKLSKENVTKYKKIFFNLLKYNTIVFLTIGLGIMLFGNLFFYTFFGIEYISSALVLKMLVPFMVLYSTAIIFNSFLDYQGLAVKRTYYFVASSLINLALNLILIPRYGALGAAISTSSAYVPYIAASWYEIRNRFKEYE